MARRFHGRVVGALASVLALAAPAWAEELTPTGQALTPAAAPGAIFQPLNPDLPDDPAFTAGQAAAVALSPDGRTLLILTSGFNRTFGPNGEIIPGRSNEYVFVWDVSGASPVKRQVIAIANAFQGLAWSPTGDRFFVSGGVTDNVMEFLRGPSGFAGARTFALGHKAGLGLLAQPESAGLAVSPDGRRLLVANIQNDSVSLIDLASGAVIEQDLRPGVVDASRRGEPGGTFPARRSLDLGDPGLCRQRARPRSHRPARRSGRGGRKRAPRRGPDPHRGAARGPDQGGRESDVRRAGQYRRRRGDRHGCERDHRNHPHGRT